MSDGDEAKGGAVEAAGDDRWRLLRAVALAAILADIVGLVGYGIAIGLVARDNGGGKVSAAPVLVVLYFVFAALLALVARGIAHRRSSARTPFVLAQVFGLIVAYTLAKGTGAVPHSFAVVVGLTSIAGFVVGVSPPFGRGLHN